MRNTKIVSRTSKSTIQFTAYYIDNETSIMSIFYKNIFASYIKYYIEKFHREIYTIIVNGADGTIDV